MPAVLSKFYQFNSHIVEHSTFKHGAGQVPRQPFIKDGEYVISKAKSRKNPVGWVIANRKQMIEAHDGSVRQAALRQDIPNVL